MVGAGGAATGVARSARRSRGRTARAAGPSARDRPRRVAAADARAWMGRPRHGRASRRHRRDGDRDRDRRAAARSTIAAAAAASGEDVTYQGVLHGRRRAGAEVLAWWERDDRGRARRCSTRSIPTCACRGASACAPPSLVTARLMETWAHGLDVCAARRRRAGRHRPPRARRVARDPRAPRTPTRSPVASRRPSRCGSSSRCRRARRGASGPADAAEPHHRPGGRVLPGVRAPPAARRCPTRLRADGPAAIAALAVARAFL